MIFNYIQKIYFFMNPPLAPKMSETLHGQNQGNIIVLLGMWPAKNKCNEKIPDKVT